MRVVIFSGDFPPMLSGVGDYCAHVSRGLSALGHSVSVVTSVGGTGGSFLAGGNVVVESILRRWNLREASASLSRLPRVEERYVVNLQYNCPATYGRRLLVTVLPSLIRMYRPHARVVVTMHGFREQSLLFRLRAVPMLRFAHGIIFVERRNVDPLKRYSGLRAERLRFIPIAGNIPPIELVPEQRKALREELGFGETQVVIAFFGGIGRSKGFHYLLEAVAMARTNFGLNVGLLGIGGFHQDGVNKDYQRQVQKRIHENGTADWVKVATARDPERVSALLRCADMAVYPFLDGVGENSGSMMAAIDHGLPTIVTRGPANPPSFEADFGVASVPAQDPHSLAEMIQALILSPQTKDRMLCQTLRVARERSWPAIASETADFFRVVLTSSD